ncbi:MAG: zinc-dependent metalloprotease [Bacteroidota bacterium]
MRYYTLLLCFLWFSACATTTTVTDNVPQPTADPITEMTQSMTKAEGYFNFYWDEAKGNVYLEIDKLDQEFLYVNSLPAGVGSNDIGLDRGQLGDTRVVKFQKVGPKILMIQPNLDYRAISNNPEEAKSVSQAFASSVIGGFKVAAASDGKYLVDLTKFLLQDAHGVAARLQRAKQGNYKVDANRSAIYMPMCKAFPKNTELEATITFSGQAKGGYIRSVTPTPNAITVRMHHSFIELPDDNYEPRVFDPRSGFNMMSYADYATPIQDPLVKRFIARHRLKKKDPSAAMSEPVEPIVYYLDRGAPEPIKSALITGASWWNQAFEAAGYKDAFIVKEMPEGADPMDVRYNLIQWVHRSTRGWSYGASVRDPRTGEIIKGHVSLGSLRVRQDFLIAQGLLSPYKDGATDPDDKMLQLALARLRQLSAHEVGHTIGLAHNFAASVKDRASVMDYPHPLVKLDANGELDFSDSYAVGIGDWDKRTVLYGYQDFPEGTDESAALQQILADNHKMGFQYISDRDARPQSGAHPVAHLWDGGENPADELRRLLEVRAKALASFGENSIRKGTPMATLENVLVPLYLAHRYQVEATTKMIGAVDYSYATRGDGQTVTKIYDATKQADALAAIMESLEPTNLTLPENIIALIPPQPIGFRRDRELFKIHTGLTFDPVGASEAIVNTTLQLLLNPAKLARVIEHHARDNQQMSLDALLTKVHQGMAASANASDLTKEIARNNEKLYLRKLLELAGNAGGNQQVTATALLHVHNFENGLKTRNNTNLADRAHVAYMLHQIGQFKNDPSGFELPQAPSLPDGSPIGCGHTVSSW